MSLKTENENQDYDYLKNKQEKAFDNFEQALSDEDQIDLLAEVIADILFKELNKGNEQFIE